MKAKFLFAYLLVVAFALSLGGTCAQAATITIDVIAAFDYPGTGNLTRPQKINDDRDIVGTFIDSGGVTRGFYRPRDGRFSDPFVEPNDTGNSTQGRAINNSRIIGGDYVNGTDGTFHGYFLASGRFTEFNVTDSLDTSVLGINNAGDFSGNFVGSDGTNQAFLSIGGAVTTISIPGSSLTALYQMNGTHQAVGYYTDEAGVTHGLFRGGSGRLAYPIDPPGSTGTILFGINDNGWMVGRYSDASGVTHGLFFIAPSTFVTFDYPGATFTSLNGINRSGYICGRYTDGSGIEHGILARVKQTAVEQSTESNPKKPATAQPNKAPAS